MSLKKLISNILCQRWLLGHEWIRLKSQNYKCRRCKITVKPKDYEDDPNDVDLKKTYLNWEGEPYDE